MARVLVCAAGLGRSRFDRTFPGRGSAGAPAGADSVDGGSASAQGSDSVDGGSASTQGSDSVDGGNAP